MNAAEYCNARVGRPWVNRAEGPDSYDCWGLVLDSFRVLDGVELPQVDGYADPDCETGSAIREALATPHYRASQPCDGAIMVVYEHNIPIHVGRCLCGGVLHSYKGSGVRHDRYQVINRRFARVEYYLAHHQACQRSREHHAA